MTGFPPIRSFRVGLASFLILLATNSVNATQNTNVADADDKEMEAKFNQYSLPYGVLGAISHLLTYWTILCHYYGRRPLQPWKTLKSKRMNVCAVLISSVVTITIVIVTLSRVHESQPLLVLASMQVVLSVVMDAINVHRYLNKKEDGLIRGTIWWGAVLYGVSYASVYAMAQMSSMSTHSFILTQKGI